MSYKTIHQCANDASLSYRITGCTAQEGAIDPGRAASSMIWGIAAATDIEAAYASALASENPDPGGDESVITDAAILTKVQSLWDTTPGAGMPLEP
jgi:hypothetical protein